MIISYFIISLLSSSSLIVANDVCANLEEIALREVFCFSSFVLITLQNSNEGIKSLLQYYLTKQGSLRSVMLKTFDLDFGSIEEEAMSSSDEAIAVLEEWEPKGDVCPRRNLLSKCCV